MLKNKLFYGLLLAPEANDTGGGGEVDTDVKTTQVNDEQLDQQLETHTPAVEGEKVEKTTATKQEKDKDKVAPPKELAGDELIGDFDDLSDKGIVTQEKLDKSKEVSVKTKAPDKVATSADTDVTKDTNTNTNKRDYSIFDENDAKVLRQAGNNPVFNWAKERLPKLYAAEKELEETKKKLDEVSKGIVKMPDSYNEHPEAYKLAPEYTNNVKFYRQADAEAEHWQQQLINIEEGDKVQLIKGVDKETGQLVLSEPVEVDSKLKLRIQQAAQTAGQYKQAFANKITELRSSHVGNYQKMVEHVTQENAKYFPWMRDENMLKTTMIEVVTEPDKAPVNVTIEQALKDANEMIHPAWRNHPLAQSHSNLIVSNLMASQKIRMLMAELGVNKQKQKDIARAEVPSSSKAGGAAKPVTEGGIKGSDAIGSFDGMDD